MTARKIVVALGGNAILASDASAQAQQRALRETAKYLVKFIQQGDSLIISPMVRKSVICYYSRLLTPNNPAMLLKQR